MTPSNSPRRAATLTDFMRARFGGLTSRLGRALWQAGVHPDALTFAGLVVVGVAGVVLATEHYFIAALILLAGAPLDALDGAVARAMGRKGKFGAMWDSTLDRYADGFIFMGLAYHFSERGEQLGLVLAMAAMLGSLLVSYARARAEGLDVDCKVGLLTRMERIVIILLMLLSGWVMAGLWVLAVGTHITVAQRVWYVHRALKAREGANNA